MVFLICAERPSFVKAYIQLARERLREALLEVVGDGGGAQKIMALRRHFINWFARMDEMIKSWLAQVATNDCREAFEKLYLHFAPGMQAFAVALVQDKAVALDLVQNLFVTLWVNRKNLAAIERPAGYLYHALKNNALSDLKSRRRVAPLMAESGERVTLADGSPETDMIRKETRQLLENAINNLPYKCRLVFRLIKEDGFRYKEVAHLLGISVKTVEAHMRLAYSRIVECLELGQSQHLGNCKHGKSSGI